VLLVDDSAVSRLALRRALEGGTRLEVVAEARSGSEALRQVAACDPDIVLMDIVMPGMDGLSATRELLASSPRPVLIISDQIGGDADRSFDALRAGALDVVGKPTAEQLANLEFVAGLQRKVRMLAGIPVMTRRSPTTDGQPRRPRTGADRPTAGEVELVCLGASTGGPPALQRILSALPRPPRWPVLVVQHMTPGFTAGMVRWLGRSTGIEVELATAGATLRPGVVHVAPDGAHLELVGRRLRLSTAPPVEGHRPSVSALLASVASTGPASATVAAVLTGMGRDGAEGLALLRQAGAWTVAQDRQSSVVFGMPGAAVECDAACEVCSLEGIASYLAAIV
jgi:two-component system chemotaxis response regulator CheB